MKKSLKMIVTTFFGSLSFCATTLAVTPLDHTVPVWKCTATATDESGASYFAMGHSYGEAYDKALNSCTIQRRHCTIDCST